MNYTEIIEMELSKSQVIYHNTMHTIIPIMDTGSGD